MRYELGRTLEALGACDDAAREFERAAALRSGWPEPREALARVRGRR